MAKIKKSSALSEMSGAYAAMFTPLDKKGRINEDAISQIIEYGISNGLKGFYLTGSTGAWFLLSPEERVQVWNAAFKAAKGRCKLIAHVGDTSTDVSVQLAKSAADAGMDWISSVAPPLFRNNFAGAYFHYSKVSSATDLPFMAYSIGSDLVPERDIRFFELKNVKGMKYTGTTFYDIQRLNNRLDKEVVFFSGSDQHAIAALSFGNLFAGSIGTVQNIIPAHFVKIHNLMLQNNFQAAAELQAEANRVVEFVCHTFHKQSLRKAAMRYIGLDCGQFRPPHEAYTEDDYVDFCAKADALGIFKRNQGIL